MRISIFFRAFCTIILPLFILNAQHKGKLETTNGVVVSAEPLASEVGMRILEGGGNAIDAAVGTGFALAVTYPTAGNLGGGGFMVIRFADGRTTTIDFRERAPGNSDRDMYLDDSGEFIPDKSQFGATAAGVPGSPAGLLYALKKYGTKSRKEVIEPAVSLAEDGFLLRNSTANSFNSQYEHFKRYTESLEIFANKAGSFKRGEVFVQKDLANTLKRISDYGEDGFYKGATAEMIVSTINKYGGIMTLKDLAEYTPVERDALVGEYKGYKIITMPPPSSGGIAMLQMLGILKNFDLQAQGWGSSGYLHLLVESMKFAYADRSKHLGDADYYKVPISQLLSEKYLSELAKRINYDKSLPSSEVIPATFSNESEETTHYSVMDKWGNCVSVTTTINSAYGSKLVVGGAGFLLNNEMDDFSAKPGIPNQFGLLGSEANSIVPGKRMLSSMTPTILEKDGAPYAIIGSPGGSTIITVVLQVLLNLVEFNMPLYQAIATPRIHYQWYPDELYYERFALSSDVKNNLIRLGHNMGSERMLGLVEGIVFDPSTGIMEGVSDPRGNGSAEGVK